MANSVRQIGRYEVEAPLGEGGMGAVYLARDPAIGRRVAIKVLRTDDEEYRRRFKIEVKAAGALRHRHIITIFDFGEHEGAPFLAMEYVPGETLAQKIARREPLPLPEKLRLVLELCDGLAHAHRAGVVHRDIKPANVIVDADDHAVKIVDFGIARVAGGSTAMTQSGLMVGTPTYMSPEQILGRGVDQRSDIFATGCVLYELLSCSRAFPGGLDDGLMFRIVYEPPAPLADVVPGLDAEVVAIVDRALEKDPAERYPDIREMSDALNRVRQRLLRQAERVPAEAPAPVPVLPPAVALPPALALPEATSTPAAPAPAIGPTTRVPRPAAIAAAIAVAAIGGLLWYFTAGDSRGTAAPPTSLPTSQPQASRPAPAIGSLNPSGSATAAERTNAQPPLTSAPRTAPGAQEVPSKGGAEQSPPKGRESTSGVPPRPAAPLSVPVTYGTVVVGPLPFPFDGVVIDGQTIAARARMRTGQLVAEFVPAAGSALPRRGITFTLASGAAVDVATLPPRGSVRFEIAPAAEVSIDTRRFGTVTEGSLTDVAAGEYPIRVQRSGYPDFSDRLQVTAGQNTVVRFAYNFATGSWIRR